MMQNIEAIILAAGSGARFGGGKLLAPYRGGALIDGAVRAALAAPVKRIVLVTGYDGEAVGETVRSLAAREGPDKALHIVHADHYAQGMAQSLKAGVGALGEDIDGAFVFLGDMPSIPSTIATVLADRIGARAAAAPVFRRERGHPVLFSSRLLPALRRLAGDRGARALLDDLEDDLALVEVDDEGVLFDVDRWSDLTA